jgi:hypothetical protein
MRRWVLAAVALLLAGCAQKKAAPPSYGVLPSGVSVVGTWKTVATNGSPGEGTLVLRDDGTFGMTVTEDGEPDSRASGTYRIGTLPELGSVPVINLRHETLNGAQLTRPRAQRLLYDSQDDLLHDMLTVAYARAEKASEVKQRLEGEERRRLGIPPKPDLGNWSRWL